MERIEINATTVYCAGDLHGNFDSITYYLKQKKLKNCAIIFCGDIGLGFESNDYYLSCFKKLKKTLTKFNIILIFIRGNHDKKEIFDKQLFSCKRIKVVQDYSVISIYPEDMREGDEIKPFNILCVGGATSIDRKLRLIENEKYKNVYQRYHSCTEEEATLNAKKIYWSDEYPVFQEHIFSELNENQIHIDCVASHTSPSFCQPRKKDNLQYWLVLDNQLDNDLTQERYVMDQVYNELPY